MPSTDDAAEHLFLSRQRFQALQRDGAIPRFPPGDVDLDVCREAYILHLRAVASGRQSVSGHADKSEGGKKLILEHERARVAKHQADGLEMKNAIMRGSLVQTSGVEQAVAEAFSRCRGRMRAIPSKASPRIVGKSSVAEVADLLTTQIDEALAELSEGAVIAAASDRSRADAGGSDQEGAPGPPAAAEADRQPVGGQAQAAKPRGQRRGRAVVD